MTCPDCQRDLNRFDPACLGCGQRYLRDVKALLIAPDEKRTWLRKVLDDWMRYGHSESDLRAVPKTVEKHRKRAR